jgi:hypothetical protein
MALTDEEIRHVQTLEGQIAGLTLAVIRVAKACVDPAQVAAELEIGSEVMGGDTARAEATALMLRLIANAIRQDAPAADA